MDELSIIEDEMIKYLETCFKRNKFYLRMHKAGLTALDHAGHSDSHDDCHTTIYWLARIEQLLG